MSAGWRDPLQKLRFPRVFECGEGFSQSGGGAEGQEKAGKKAALTEKRFF